MILSLRLPSVNDDSPFEKLLRYPNIVAFNDHTMTFRLSRTHPMYRTTYPHMVWIVLSPKENFKVWERPYELRVGTLKCLLTTNQQMLFAPRFLTLSFQTFSKQKCFSKHTLLLSNKS